MSASAAPGTCRMVADLTKADEVAEWAAVNDGVMGGRSSGGPRYSAAGLVFEGVINTNGGGFSSVRRGLAPGSLSGSDGIMVRVKTDGRAYRLTIRTAERFRGRTVAYTAGIRAGDGEDWAEVFVPYDQFQTSVFGRAVLAAPLDPATAWSIGFILGDGRDGSFAMQAEWIKACMTGESSA
ncbi:MAG: CIA30 family protein [Pseudomonadota bacterium]